MCILRGLYADARLDFALKCVRSGPTGLCPRLVAPRVRKTGPSGGLASLTVLLAAGLLRQLNPLPSAVEPEAIAVSCQCTCPAAASTPCPAVCCETAPELPVEAACLPTWQLQGGARFKNPPV